MKKASISLLLIFFVLFSRGQEPYNTGTFHGVYQENLYKETDIDYWTKPNWGVSVFSMYPKNKQSTFVTNEIKKQKTLLKEGSSFQAPANKTTGAAPTIGTNFRGNDLKSWTPTDNSIAVSNGGIIISCINEGFAVYDTSGNTVLPNVAWSTFVNDPLLNQAMFDPRVVYDNKHDRFVMCVLHGFSSTTTRLVLAFSKTNNPVDGWYIYKLNGNPFSDSSWSDYPSMGINDDEVFINLNRFGDAPTYNWKETYLYQVGLQEGYAGTSLNYGLWNNIYTPDGDEGITVCPAGDGLGQSLKNKMYFVHTRPDTGSTVYAYVMNGNLLSSSKSLTCTAYSIPKFEVCGNAKQKDPTTGFLDSLYSGNAWIQNAYSLNGAIHYTQCADYGLGWCGINYGRIFLDSNKVSIGSFGQIGTDYSYPAVASFAWHTKELGAVIAYTQSDATMTPQTGIISIDHNMLWSGSQVVKAGDTSVNILYPPAYPVSPERWGDYTGICRKYNSQTPKVWMAGAFGANTPPRMASWGTWIAEIITNDPVVPVGIQEATNKSNSYKLYPNPAVDMFTLSFDVKHEGRVRIFITDMNGSIVKNLYDDNLPLSSNKVQFNKLMLAKGIYQVVVALPNQEKRSEKLVIK